MNILIIGKNSYIGNHIDQWLSKYGHFVCQLDVLVENWRVYDYSLYDVIIHVAGIVHRPNCKDWNLYKSVNCDMAAEIAQKAKLQGVRQYIYFSTMGVYNASKSLNGCVIDENTPTLKDGNSLYGKSKLMAEEALSLLQEYNFTVAFVRPPSVYGNGCKGGYITSFKWIACKLPLFPKAYEHCVQSFIYIDNLCECIRLIVDNQLAGIFCPQDDEIPNANRLLETICNSIGKRYHASKVLGLCFRFFSFLPCVKKAYGGISYSRKISDIQGYNYVIVPFEEGIKRTVS